ncbi:hypothetical protein ACQP1W_01350 [Spirillospora sp. CA-255316]
MDVTAATTRLKEAGPATFTENDASCWGRGVGDRPRPEPWEVCVLKADAGTISGTDNSTACACGA